jgi:hypothetical protein
VQRLALFRVPLVFGLDLHSTLLPKMSSADATVVKIAVLLGAGPAAREVHAAIANPNHVQPMAQR